jgi:tRNA pseudouridine38-40 synthase
MRNFKLTIEYDGSGFSGWQVQPELRTVQGELYRALGEIAGEDIKIVGSGRTDAGVHAVGQVASVMLDTELQPATLKRALRGKLPGDIVVRSVDEVPPSFNARYDARSRRYHYIFIDRPSALWRNYYHEVPGSIDPSEAEEMRIQLRALEGRHDFSAFTASGSNSGSKVCTVMQAELIESRPLVILSVTADRFLYNMMRSIAGTVLRAATGRGASIEEVLASRERAAAGPTLPPSALYLMEVRY